MYLDVIGELAGKSQVEQTGRTFDQAAILWDLFPTFHLLSWSE
jgi:hypothetical protein